MLLPPKMVRLIGATGLLNQFLKKIFLKGFSVELIRFGAEYWGLGARTHFVGRSGSQLVSHDTLLVGIQFLTET
jgi:hypothetical protein